MLTISKPLSAEQAQTHHKKEFTSEQQSYWSRGNAVHGDWQVASLQGTGWPAQRPKKNLPDSVRLAEIGRPFRSEIRSLEIEGCVDQGNHYRHFSQWADHSREGSARVDSAD